MNKRITKRKKKVKQDKPSFFVAYHINKYVSDQKTTKQTEIQKRKKKSLCVIPTVGITIIIVAVFASRLISLVK